MNGGDFSDGLLICVLSLLDPGKNKNQSHSGRYDLNTILSAVFYFIYLLFIFIHNVMFDYY